jgi:hypothetical protein
MATPKIPTPANPKLIDKILFTFNAKLAVQLPWLDYAFGQAEKMTKIKNKKPYVYPAVYAGQNIDGEYRSVLPDEFLGQDQSTKGFSFFQVDDPDYFTSSDNSSGIIEVDAAIVFWFNLKKVLDDSAEYRNWDGTIDQIIKAIRKSNRGFKGQILPTGWTKDTDKIYKGYSLRDTEQKFLMHPFAGVRINCTIKTFEQC